MKKIYYLIFIVFITFISSCTDDFEEYNTDQKNPPVVPGEALFSSAEKALADQVSNTNVNYNIFKLISQYWTETTYTDEANYNITNRNISNTLFSVYYRDILKDLDEAQKIISAVEEITPELQAVQANKLAIIDLLQVYAYQTLVDIFGDVPYTEALDITNPSPKYDDAATIYTDLIARVTADVAALDDENDSFGDADFIYGGDVSAWIKFGNSLKLRLGIGIADGPLASLGQKTVEDAVAAGIFESSDDNCMFGYLAASPNANQLYVDLVETGRHDFVAANTIIDVMTDLGDPRLYYYFDQNLGDGVFDGGEYGESSPFADYSHVADAIQEPTFPGVLLTYDEMLFYLAEAAERGYNVPKSAETYYNEAITASILWWGGTTAEANAYLAKASVKYTGDVKEIATQAWIAFYTRGMEGWNEWRRLDAPTLNIPPAPYNNQDFVIVRFTYPGNEQTLNATNYAAASAAIGGDKVLTPLFWDIN